MKIKILFYLVVLLTSTYQNSFAQTVGYPITEPNYIQPIGNRPLDKTKPSVTLAGEVNIANGTATYSLPINLPPGVQGMQPNLAITYNSNGGNGQLGLGWALAGTSAISRGGSSHFIDGTVAPVTLTNDDNLYLDGQRLLPYDGKSGFLANAEYRTLTESYQKIEFIDNDIIRVTQKDGITRYYGGTNARLRLTNPNTQTEVTYMWFLFKVEDRNGNYMIYEYVIDANNEARLNKINYTANDAAGVTAKTEVQFHYTTRTDARSGYLLGNELHNSLLLHEISVMHNNTQYGKYTLNYMFDPTPKLGNDFSKLVEIQYQAQTKELNSVVVRWPDLPQQEATLQYTHGHSSKIDDFGQELAGDFNGDGTSDLLILHHSEEDDGMCFSTKYGNIMNHFQEYWIELKRRDAGTFTTVWTSPVFRSEWWKEGCHREPWARIYPGDFNGDRLMDFALCTAQITGSKPSNRDNKYYLDIYLNDALNPGIFLKQPMGEIDPFLEEPQGLIFADLNGDGLCDYAYYREWTSITLTHHEEWLFNYVSVTNGQLSIQTYQSPIEEKKLQNITYADFDADGDIDFIVRDGSLSCLLYIADDGILLNPIALLFSAVDLLFPTDMNGDGLVDIVSYSKWSTPSEWEVFLFDGKSFVQSTTILNGSNISDYELSAANWQNYTAPFSNIPPFLLDATNDWPVFADFDADGRTDFGFITADGTKKFEISYNKITGWEHSTIILSWDAIDLANQRFSNLHYMDLEGKGELSLFYDYKIYSPSPVVFTNWAITFRPDDFSRRVSSILDGANTQTTFTYKPLTNTTVYTRGNTENYPNPVITAPLYVVSNVTQTLFDGTTTANTNYQYQAARVNTLGLGLLGFEKITATDVVEGRRSVSTFALPTTQMPQYKTQPMLPQKTEVFSTTNNTLLASSEYTYYGTVVQTNPLIFPWQYNPQVQEEKSKDFVHGTSAKSSLTYDAYGNPTNSTSYTYNNTTFTAPYVSKTEEAATFTIQSGSWLLWLPSSTTTTVTRYGQTPAVQHSTFSYDASTGNLLTATANPGSEAEIATAYQYDDFGNPTQKTVTPQNMAARTTSYTYTTDGRFLETETNPLNWTVTYMYDDLKAVRIKQTDFNNLVTEWEHDEFGRVTKEIAPDLTEVNTTYAFFTGTNPTYLFHNTISGTAMPPSEEFLDGLGRARQKRTKNRSDVWVNVRTDFDSRGRQYRTSQPYFAGETPLWNTTTFDDNNRPTAISTASGNSTAIVYSGRTTTTTNTHTGQTKSSTVDADGLTLTATDAGGTIAYTYNSFGKPLSITGPSGTPITSTYDDYGRQIELNDPAAGPMRYEYDALGQLVQQVDNAGNTYTITYDLLGRTTQKTGPEGVYTYTFDIGFLGAPETQSGPNNISTTTHYDALGRPEAHIETVNGTAYATHYTYTTNGQLATKTYPNNFGVNYAYDTYGYLSEMTRADDSRLIWQYTSENRFGQLTDYMLGDNTAWTKTYDDVSGLPTGIDNNKNWGMSYSFDVHTGNLNSRSHNYNGQSESFGYDPLDRLEAYGPATAQQTVTYANTGSITTKTDAGTYTNHAPTGRTTAVSHPTGQPGFAISEVAQNITYTAFNSVETINEGNFDAFFTYGPDQQRKHMVINENGSTYIERYYLNGGSYERDRLPNGDWRNLTYISTPAGLSAVFIQNENTQEADLYFLHTDYQGSILAIADYQGDILEEYSYDPWGNRRDPNNWQNIYTNTTSPTAGQSGGQSPLWGVGGLLFRGYTAHEHLDCFALINMNGRMYDPVLGRMLSPDNFAHSGTQGLNRYAYVFNNPLKYTDPSGEIPWFVPVIAGAIIGGYAGGAIHSGELNPLKWNSDAWKAVITGALIGAGAGYVGGMVLAAKGYSISLASGSMAFGPNILPTTSMKVLSNSLLSSNIGIFSALIQGEGIDGALKAGLIGLVSGGMAMGLNLTLQSHTSLSARLIQLISQGVGGSFYGGADRFFKVKENGIHGSQLLGYTMLGMLEGGITGIYSAEAGMNYGFKESIIFGNTIAVTSFSGLTFSLLDLMTGAEWGNILGIKDYIKAQTPHYPTSVNLVKTIEELADLILGK